MRRLFALIILIAAIAPVTWIRMAPMERSDDLALRFVPVRIGEGARTLGPFQLESAWRMESRHRLFGGYSALLRVGQGRFLALSDSGATLHFSAPHSDTLQAEAKVGRLFSGGPGRKTTRDVEAITADLETGHVWVAMEFTNAIARFAYHNEHLVLQAKIRPTQMDSWGSNSGPESLLRLSDGRFLTLREGFTGWLESRNHLALLFTDDPVEKPAGQPFWMVGPRGFSPTAMTMLADGRVLILFRRVMWRFPPGFAGAIAIGDPREIARARPWRVKTLAQWGASVPGDNFEGIATGPGKNGRLNIWLISDDNRAAFQSTMFWKLTVDPKDLPARREKARGKPTRPS